MSDDTKATLAELISQLKAAPQAWKNIFHARYFKPDRPGTYFDASSPEAEELLKPYPHPQRQKRLDQIKAYFDELLRCAGTLAGAREDEDALASWLNLLRRESARFRPLGDGTLDNVLDATVELLEPVELLARLGRPAQNGTKRHWARRISGYLNPVRSIDPQHPRTGSLLQSQSAAEEPAAAEAAEPEQLEDDDPLAHEFFLRPDGPLEELLTDDGLRAKWTETADGLKSPPATADARGVQISGLINLLSPAAENIFGNAASVEEADQAFAALICWAANQTHLAAEWLEGRQEDGGFRGGLALKIRQWLYGLPPYMLARQKLAERIERKRAGLPETNAQPGEQPYREFPLMLYRAGGETKIVHDEKEREAMLAKGWSRKPVTWEVNPKTGRRIWAPEINRYEEDNDITDDELAHGLGVSVSTLRSIKRGDKRHGAVTEENALLKMRIAHD
jgi:hypothetical protein